MKSARTRSLKLPNQPLAGIRILVGRAHHQASTLSAGLRKLGADVIEIPFIEIRKPRSYRRLDAALKRLAEYDWLILTSVNGVKAVCERVKRLRRGTSDLQKLRIAAIGPATKAAIERHRLKVDVLPAQYVAESVVNSLRHRVTGKRILLARAKAARDVIPRELRKLGAHVDVAEAYQTVMPASSRRRLLALLRDSRYRPNVVTFTSSSTVRNFVALLGRRSALLDTPLLGGVRFASIGPVTSATLRDFRLTPHIEAREYTVAGLIEAICRSVAAEH
jgi:uroporphyrinogen-III synthase